MFSVYFNMHPYVFCSAGVEPKPYMYQASTSTTELLLQSSMHQNKNNKANYIKFMKNNSVSVFNGKEKLYYQF
jgi:hypothetical protein